MPNILVISDNEVFKADLLDQISHYAPEFNIANAIINADVVVIDEKEDILHEITAKNLKTPLIFLTSQNNMPTAAWQVLEKPLFLSHLLDMIKAAINVFERSADGSLEFNRYILYPARKEILNCRNDETTKLTEKEVAIIKYLYKNQERIISKNDLMREVWGYSVDVATHTVETHIYRLRQKVEKDNPEAQLILTSDGGYQLKV